MGDAFKLFSNNKTLHVLVRTIYSLTDESHRLCYHHFQLSIPTAWTYTVQIHKNTLMCKCSLLNRHYYYYYYY